MSQAGLFKVYLTLLAIELLEYWPRILKHCISEKKKVVQRTLVEPGIGVESGIQST